MLEIFAREMIFYQDLQFSAYIQLFKTLGVGKTNIEWNPIYNSVVYVLHDSLALFVIFAPCKKAFRFSQQCTPHKTGLIGCSLSVLSICQSVLYIYHIPHLYFMQLDQIDL